jgi:hypothetical protein
MRARKEVLAVNVTFRFQRADDDFEFDELAERVESLYS